MHPFDVNNPAIGLKFQIFAGQMGSTAFAIRPFVTDLAVWSRILFAEALDK